jgi:hypothetical protein
VILSPMVAWSVAMRRLPKHPPGNVCQERPRGAEIEFTTRSRSTSKRPGDVIMVSGPSARSHPEEASPQDTPQRYTI